MFSDFISLIFPRSCVSCDQALYKREDHLCSYCKFRLPKTNYHTDPDNPLRRRFWGKIPITDAFAYLKFSKGGSVQNILYKIKYKRMKECARELGKWYGRELCQKDIHKSFDLLVPVPLHKKKQKARGYNQSDLFAEGLSISMGIPFNTEAMERVSERTSQTLKNRLERWNNVKDIYKVKEAMIIKNKHILLVDDVVTSGATFEACARELLNEGARAVSIVAIACAE